MTAAHDQTARLSTPLRVLTRYVAFLMAFALGFILAFVTKLQPHLVALAFGVALLSSIYCLSLGIYLWFNRRQDSSASSS